jgi:hypothetical protein
MTSKELADKHLVFRVLSGSRAYGFSTPESDYDYRSVYVPPEEYYLGMKAFDLLDDQTENDEAYYSLRKFAHLAAANNPNVLEILFVDPSDIVYQHPAFQSLLDIRQNFLSQKCAKTYVGYASAQLHRIRNHKRWLSQELHAMEVLLPLVETCVISKAWIQWRFGTNMVERIELEVPRLEAKGQYEVKKAWEEQGIDTKMDTYLGSLADTGLAEPSENDPQFFRIREIGTQGQTVVFDSLKFKEAKNKRLQYTEWMANRDPKRHKLELKFGYDCRHAAHLVRLLRSGYEILTEGKLLVRRPDAKELLGIRSGDWTYEQITDYADEMINKINDLSEFAVPDKPDFNTIDRAIIDITKEVLWPKVNGRKV